MVGLALLFIITSDDRIYRNIDNIEFYIDISNRIESSKYIDFFDISRYLKIIAILLKYRQKPKPKTMGYIFAAVSVCASPSMLKQSCLKTRASALNDSTRKTVLGAKWLFKFIQGHPFRCR